MNPTQTGTEPQLFRLNIEVGDLDRAAPFYAQDPWGNPLCFVDRGTIYAG